MFRSRRSSFRRSTLLLLSARLPPPPLSVEVQIEGLGEGIQFNIYLRVMPGCHYKRCLYLDLCTLSWQICNMVNLELDGILSSEYLSTSEGCSSASSAALSAPSASGRSERISEVSS